MAWHLVRAASDRQRPRRASKTLAESKALQLTPVQTMRPMITALSLLLLSATTAFAQEQILKCPIAQKAARNGDAPDAELLKKLVRCRKGEKAADPGSEGAVTVEVTELKVGTPRAWDPRRDSGSGDRGTKVFPIKVTYTDKTHYRTRTVVGEDWIRVMNFYVDAFGEWQSGSEEPVKSPTTKSIPK